MGQDLRNSALQESLAQPSQPHRRSRLGSKWTICLISSAICSLLVVTGPVAAEIGSKVPQLVLRGALLPSSSTVNPGLASSHDQPEQPLLHPNMDVTERLTYANFRYSAKQSSSPPAGVQLAAYRPIARSAMSAAKTYRAPKRNRNRHSFVKWLATPGCVPGRLKRVLRQVARRYGKVTVNSTHRSIARNRKVGGAKHSYHLTCQAIDFRLHGNIRRALAYLKRQRVVGGLKHYGGGLFHIDTGPRRSW